MDSEESVLSAPDMSGQPLSPRLPPTPEQSGGFRGALQDVQKQLSRLSGLVDILAAQHELEVAKLAPKRSSFEAHLEPLDLAVGRLESLRGGKAAALVAPETNGQAVSRCRTPGKSTCTTPKSSGSSRSSTEDQTFPLAVQNMDVAKVHELLDQNADPNKIFREFECEGLTFTSCTPLVLAVQNGHRGLVRLLMHAKADPQIEYSFQAGAEQIHWSGPAIHACMPTGDISMLRELIHLRADVNVSSYTGANLVWQAAYFGHVAVLQLLLDQGVDFECPAKSQDDSTLSLTPLHAAAKAGNVGTTSALLDAKANFLVESSDFGLEPLDDAVTNGHAGVVQLLVSRQADIFKESAMFSDGSAKIRGMNKLVPSWTRSVSIHTKRRIDVVFSSKNPVLVSAVARGLRDMPQLPGQFSRAELLRFISTPGDAAEEIWSAVFRQHFLRYWTEVDSRLTRVATRAAFVDAKLGMNITEGPAPRYLQARFKSKRVLPEDVHTSFARVLARQNSHGSTDPFVPVLFYACQLPFLHEDLQVILALAYCESDKILELPGCRAIVELKWSEERMGAQVRMVLAFAEIINLVLFNAIENKLFGEPKYSLEVATVLALVVWLVVTVIEVAQAVGYSAHGMAARYFVHVRHSFDAIVLLGTGIIIFWTWSDPAESSAYRILLGIVVSLKWARVLISLRQLQSVGLRILPILSTLLDVGPFLAVLSVYGIAAVQMLYALGLHSLEDAFLIMYRLVVLGDMSLSELEGDSLQSFTESRGVLRELPSPASEYREVVRVIMIFVSFLMGISLMNLFIAILTVSYSEAEKRAPAAFVRSRAGILLDQHAARKGLRILFCCRRKGRRQKLAEPLDATGLASQPSAESLSTNTDDRMTEQDVHDCSLDHIWFALPVDSQ